MNPTTIAWTDFTSNPIYAVHKETGKRGWFCEVEFLAQVFNTMAQAPQHTFQLLTKRPARMTALLTNLEANSRLLHVPFWPLPNVWLGVSVENQHFANLRIPLLLETPAAVRFLSCEPLLGPLDLGAWLCQDPDCEGPEWCPYRGNLHWIIIGGESAGPKRRYMKPEWAQSLVGQGRAAGIPVRFKQGSGSRPGMDEDLLGEKIQEVPHNLTNQRQNVPLLNQRL